MNFLIIKILSREFDRNMQVYESVQERIFCLPASCALAAGLLVYLGPYQFPFRRIMLTNNWIKCLNDRGLPLVLDSINLIKGRVVKWQMESLVHLLANSNIVPIPGDDWKVHFASDQIDNQLFMGNASQSDVALDKPNSQTDSKNKQFTSESRPILTDNTDSIGKTVTINEPNRKSPQSPLRPASGKKSNETKSPEKTSEDDKNEEDLIDGSELEPNDNGDDSGNKNVEQSDEKNREPSFYEESMLKMDAHPLSRLSEQVSIANKLI